MVFTWFWLGLTGFYWVLLGSSWLLPGFTGFYSALLGFTGFYRVLTGFDWVFTGFDREGLVLLRFLPSRVLPSFGFFSFFSYRAVGRA